MDRPKKRGKYKTGKRETRGPYVKPPILVKIDDGSAKMCNCAACGKELLSADHARELAEARQMGSVRAFKYFLVAGRIADRPYCYQDIASARFWNRPEARD